MYRRTLLLRTKGGDKRRLLLASFLIALTTPAPPTPLTSVSSISIAPIVSGPCSLFLLLRLQRVYQELSMCPRVLCVVVDSKKKRKYDGADRPQPTTKMRRDYANVPRTNPLARILL